MPPATTFALLPEKKSGNAAVILLPWDPESPKHVERLYQQRIACGWNSQAVDEVWRDAQRTGKKAIRWIVRLLHSHRYIAFNHQV
jgi:hypothetical protein